MYRMEALQCAAVANSGTVCNHTGTGLPYAAAELAKKIKPKGMWCPHQIRCVLKRHTSEYIMHHLATNSYV